MKIIKSFCLLFFTLLSFTSLIGQIGEDFKIVKGEIISAEDTGLGPYYGVIIIDQADGNEKYFMILIDDLLKISSDGNFVGKTVSIKYKINSNIFVTDLMLQSEFEVSNSKRHVYISGKFLSGDIGDMGSYITLELSDGSIIDYNGDFEIDVTNPKYINKNVVIYYEDQIENEVIELSEENLGNNTFKGIITAVYPGENDDETIIIIENDIEFIDAVVPFDIAGSEDYLKSLINNYVEIEYSTTLQKMIISYSIESEALNESKTSDEAFRFFEYYDKFTDIGRYVDLVIENENTYLEIETSDGRIFENVLVYPGLGLDDKNKYQDKELLFTYVNENINTVTSFKVTD